MLTIYRAHRADALVAALGQVLSEPAGDPFEAELVCVPSKGVERWISQYLAGVLGVSPFPSAQRASDGVCAHVRFPSVRRLVAETLAAVTGMDPATDPWAPGKLLWSVLAVIDECETESWCASLGRHLGAVADAGAGESRESEHWEYVLAGGADRAQRRGRRVAVARKLANLFTRYGNARPELILGWLAGPGNGSGEDEGVPADLGWQAELFRRVRARVGTPSPAERLESACAKLRADPESVELPERLAIFGPTRLELTEIRVLDALAARRSVRLFLPHPSPAAWQRTADTMTDSADDPVLAGEFAESLGWRDEGASQVVDLANRNPCWARWVATHANSSCDCSPSCIALTRSCVWTTRCQPGWSAAITFSAGYSVISTTIAFPPNRRMFMVTAQWRCTHVTVECGRSRCCVRWSWACWPTIRRWSCATSW